MSEKKIRIRLVHSTIGRDERQDKIVKGLGLRTLNGERTLVDTPAVRGMVAKVPHLVRIVQENVVSGAEVKKSVAGKRAARKVAVKKVTLKKSAAKKTKTEVKSDEA